MAFRSRNGKKDRKKKSRMAMRPRVCRFCVDKKLVIDYKEGKALSPFITERGKIIPRRISGNCARHQREMNQAIKRARVLALIPYTATHQTTS